MLTPTTEPEDQITSSGKARAGIVRGRSSKNTTIGTSSSITSTTPNNVADKLIPCSGGDHFGHGVDGKAHYKYNDGDAATAGGLVAALRRRGSSLKNSAAAILSSSLKQRNQDPAGTISTKKRRPSGLKSDLDFDLDMNNFNSAGKNYMTRTTKTDSSRRSSAFLSP
eukprot:CAMPEP_0203743058 /NCGR_PEP_ID=MMETSP0092-20131115/59243_1 /ASSEMBLY_ACC=CAM_ASM_001090 /TAXON_ID=426623 /ORGANISM="Chaetoceros affinis, Strain CCMP159" /LENGTH=166 /DNA_ID=CAMNT_0050630335 /DNA_START=644 /DNA_END=1140 /DNA_ORIENTATION=+